MRRIALALSALALLAGCGLLQATLEVPTVTIAVRDQQFPAAPSGAGTQTVTADVGYDLNQQIPELLKEDVTFTLKLKELSLTATSGDLGFIDAMTVEAVPPSGSSLPALLLVDYTKPSPAPVPPPTTITSTAAAGDDLAPYLESGLLTFHFTVTGTLPTAAWTADALGAFALDATLKYGNKL